MGTMCLVRRSVLSEVGGWGDWCVTEDSELSCGSTQPDTLAADQRNLWLRIDPGDPRRLQEAAVPMDLRAPSRNCGGIGRLCLPRRWGDRVGIELAQRLCYMLKHLYGLAAGIGLFLLPGPLVASA